MSKLFEGLTEEEDAVYQWQCGYAGGFAVALMELIGHADAGNQERLKKAFPVEVRGYQHFAYEDGWWQKIERKVKEASMPPEVPE